MYKILLTIILIISCNNKKLDGNWKATLNIQGKKTPFNIKIYDNSKKAKLYNASETIELDAIKIGNKYNFQIANFDNALVLERKDDQLIGHWVKYNKKNEYKLNIKAKKGSWDLRVTYPEDFPKRWKIVFTNDKGKKSDALLLFTHNHASILTPTGDYRFLTPVFKDKKLSLYGFDGAFSFHIDGQLNDNSYKGVMYSGLDWSEKFTATPSEDFQLPDSSKITSLKSKAINVCLKNLKDEKQCISNSDNRAKVIQIFGSWCPNCIDETKFIKKFRKNNNAQVDFYIVSFERGLTEKISLKSLKKAKGIYEIDYPVLIGGLTKEIKVSDVFKGIDNFASFPTTIFVSKSGKIVEVHSGFSGPATGIYYDNFKKKFKNLIELIQKK